MVVAIETDPGLHKRVKGAREGSKGWAQKIFAAEGLSGLAPVLSTLHPNVDNALYLILQSSTRTSHRYMQHGVKSDVIRKS